MVRFPARTRTGRRTRATKPAKSTVHNRFRAARRLHLGGSPRRRSLLPVRERHRLPGQLSLSMPRRAAPWKGIAVEAYIDGILPDDPAVRQRIAHLHDVNARNPFSLLTAVGLDCGGGVQFIPEKSDSLITEMITPISKEQIGQRLEKYFSNMH